MAPFDVCAVNYLNTVPLIWGMLRGPQKDLVRLSFEIPSVCAEFVERGAAQIGLVPVAEIVRQQLETVPGYGIACVGAVRSILLVSRVPLRKIRTLAADLSSRTSIQLARVILRERYGVEPDFERQPPVLDNMLASCDAALLIGDPALRVEPDSLPLEAIDLGAEWFELTGLPMVFAQWAGKSPLSQMRLQQIVSGSYAFGKQHIEELVDAEFEKRKVTRELAHQYVTRNIRYEVREQELKGLEAFVSLAGLEAEAAAPVSAVR
jgi:predicted solute-binding protein